MMNTSIYSILSICQNQRFLRNTKYGDQICKAIKCLHQNAQLIDELEIKHLIKGWSLPLVDKIQHNQLTDVMNVNLPKYFDEAAFSSFVFAEFMPPGLHQKLIHCPQTDTFWIAHFLVDLNTKDFYPEFPQMYMNTKLDFLRSS